MSNDPLSQFSFPESSGGLFMSVKKGDSIKIRVLTTDPVVHNNDYKGNISTRYAFVVWNYEEDKAQVLDKGASIARMIQQLHTDSDWGADIQKLDVKLIATSTGNEDKDVEYSLQPLPKSSELTAKQIEEAAKIDLMKAVKGGTRMSEFSKPKQSANVDLSPEVEDEVELDNDKVDLSDVPF